MNKEEREFKECYRFIDLCIGMGIYNIEDWQGLSKKEFVKRAKLQMAKAEYFENEKKD